MQAELKPLNLNVDEIKASAAEKSAAMERLMAARQATREPRDAASASQATLKVELDDAFAKARAQQDLAPKAVARFFAAVSEVDAKLKRDAADRQAAAAPKLAAAPPPAVTACAGSQACGASAAVLAAAKEEEAEATRAATEKAAAERAKQQAAEAEAEAAEAAEAEAAEVRVVRGSGGLWRVPLRRCLLPRAQPDRW